VDLVTEHDLLAETEPEDGRDRGYRCHQMLLRLAGRAPDGLLTQAREWLACGQFGHLARSVIFWAVSQDAVLARADAALLSRLRTEPAADPSEIARLTLDDLDRLPCYAFARRIPAGPAGAVATPGAGARSDEAAVRAAAAAPAAVGVWRAWRYPADGAPWPPPRRVFVIETGAADEPDLAARMQLRLAAAGEVDPQVEVYQSGTELPIYQDLARAHGELLWAAAPDTCIQLAPIFDDVGVGAGPLFRPGHPILDDDESAKVVRYLLDGEPLLVTEELMDDVLDSEQAGCVPMSFRTDGRWIWNEASAYYAQRYGLQPHAGLVAHVRSNGYLPPPVDGVTVHRALRVLQDRQGEEPDVVPDEPTLDLTSQLAGVQTSISAP
jgi:hypothetical protein